MKINKLIIRIAHFFGKMKDTHHIDDVTVNIELEEICDSETRLKYLFGNGCLLDDWALEINEKIKQQIYKKLENENLRKRCESVSQIWTTFYSKKDTYRKGSLMFCIHYIDGKLYFKKEKNGK